MKCYAIRDDAAPRDDLAFLFYDAASGRFFIELKEVREAWLLPPPLDSFFRRGLTSVSSEWAARFVAARIVPPDRQNLGMILKENGLRTYDPMKLLLLADGRCAQDDCFIVPVGEEALPKEIRNRLQRKVLDVIPLSERRVIVSFRDGLTRLIPLAAVLQEDLRFLPVLREEEVFCRVRVTPLGSGIEWDEKTVIPAETLYVMGEELPLKPEDFEQFTKYRTLDTTMLAARMHCSRQYIKQLTDKGSLHPLRAGSNHVLYPAREAEAG